MTASNSERCPKCGQTKTASKSGSLTQWINVCGCENLEALPETDLPAIQFCAICAKRITTERKGSLTQFIFRSDVCKCENPRIADPSAPEMARRIAEATKIDLGPENKELTAEEIEELAADFSLSVEKFPFERYSPVKIIGEGASGVVYLAKDRSLGKPVAIKCLHRLEAAQLVSFQNEARATSKLNHEGIVAVYDFGATTAGVPYMVMEFVDGTSLSEILKQQKRLSSLMVARIIVQAARALSHAHFQFVFHRDVKPSNLILCGDKYDPAVKIIDFGVAQLRAEDDTKSLNVDGHALVGTPAYMAPELASGGEYSAASEVYSIGCTMFQCLTGRAPFTSDNALALIRKHVNEPPPLVGELIPEVSEELEEIVSKCLEKDPANRYKSAAELAEHLKETISIIKDAEDKAAAEKLVEDAAFALKPLAVTPDSEPKGKGSLIVVFALIGFLIVGGLFGYRYLQTPVTSIDPDAEKQTATVKEPVKMASDAPNDMNYLDETFQSIDFDGRLISEGKGTRKKIDEFVKKYKTAQTIMIRSDEVTDDLLPTLVNLRPGLLSLSNCHSLTDAGILHFAKLKGLHNLCLDENPQITPQGWKNLSVVPGLNEITIKECDLDGADIKALTYSKELFNLDLRDNPRVTIEALEQLGKRPINTFVLIAGCAADKATPEEKAKLERKCNLKLSSGR